MIWNVLLASFALLTPPATQVPPGHIIVTGEWLEQNLDNPDLVILQASSDGADYEAEHIPGARLVLSDQIAWEGETAVGMELRSFDEIREALERVGVSDESVVVVYGSNPMLAARLWMTLDVANAGAGDPAFLNGGIQSWKAAGRPLTTELPTIHPGRLTAPPETGKLVTGEWILARLGHDYLSLIDARPTDEFTGADGGLGGEVNPGHIPNARQLYWEDLIDSRDNPEFLPYGQLAARFAAAGADMDEIVVTYCQVGLRASVTYLVARVLGYDTRFYDGSWREWGSTDFPHIAQPRRARADGGTDPNGH